MKQKKSTMTSTTASYQKTPSRQPEYQSALETNNFETKPKKTTGTQDTQISKPYQINLDEMDQYIEEDRDQIFISSEEQSKIQAILQIANKGKISLMNAFQLPIFLMKTGYSGIQSAQFWKFSSDLLAASMQVYDKRIDNLFVASNTMIGTLRLSQCNQQLIQKASKVSKESKSSQKINNFTQQQIDLNDILIQNYDWLAAHCDQGQKITFKQGGSQFLNDPMMGRRLKLFDGGSLQSLFLNVLQCTKTQELNFFKKQIHNQQLVPLSGQKMAKDNQFRLKQGLLQYIQAKIARIKAPINFSQYSSFLLNRQADQQQGKLYTDQLLINFQRALDHGLQKLDHDEWQTDVQQIEQFNQYLNVDQSILDFKFVTQENIQTDPYQTPSNRFSKYLRQYDTCILNQDQIFTQTKDYMTPKDLQLKGYSLIKQKRRLLVQKKQSVRKVAIKLQGQINFDPEQKLERRNVFNNHKFYQFDYQKASQSKSTKSSKASEKKEKNNTIGDPHLRFLRNARQKITTSLRFRSSRQYTYNQLLYNSNSQEQNIFNDQTYGSNYPQADGQNQIISPQDYIIGQNITDLSFQNLVTFGMRNIAQSKEYLTELVQQRDQLMISEIMQFPLSLASSFIVCLHLVNQKKILMSGVQNEDDIRLCSIRND